MPAEKKVAEQRRAVKAGKMELSSPVQYLKGVGPERAEALKEVGVLTVEDLLYYLPRRYLDRSRVVPISDLKIGEEVTVVGNVVALKFIRRLGRFVVTLHDGSGYLSLVWFNTPNFLPGYFERGWKWPLPARSPFMERCKSPTPILKSSALRKSKSFCTPVG